MGAANPNKDASEFDKKASVTLSLLKGNKKRKCRPAIPNQSRLWILFWIDTAQDAVLLPASAVGYLTMDGKISAQRLNE